MVEQQEDQKIDTNLYSRQIGTFGIETMGKLVKMNVLIVGLRGLGVETAKNLILAGPKSVTLYDPSPVTWGDLSSNFYCREEHVGKVSRAQASFTKLQELNPYVKVTVIDSLNLEDHAHYNVVTYTEIYENIDKIIEVNEFCRARSIGFILSLPYGAAGFTFLDYGTDFSINDADGEDTKAFIVVNATQTNPCIVTVHEDKRHKFQDGDYVSFREVEGMIELNSLPPTQIDVIDGFSFKLKVDASNFGAYTREGLVENVKVPKKVSYHSLKQSMHNPTASSQYGMLETPDLRCFGRSEQLHLAILAIFEFQKHHERLPGNNSTDADWILNAAKRINEENKANEGHTVDEIDEKVIRNTALYSAACITPMAAFFGGVVAQEIVKYTGKYSPLKQWLHYDIFESLPRTEADRTPMNCRYDDQILVYGREVQEKLKKVKTFMIGAGALGCEYVKAFSLMGLGCSEEGHVTVTDNDNIEVSNLNRQFLFRKNNVGDSKSRVACSIAKDINSDLNVTDYKLYVASETESIFNDKFWENLDFIVNAVDNIKARLYVDSRCVWYAKPLLESGTLGTKANSQMIIPYKTQCYGDSQDPPEEAIPMCTLRNFPNQIEHCIEWGRDLFNRVFVDTPNDAVGYLEKPQSFIFQLKQNTTSSGVRTTMEEIKKLVDLKKSADFTKCVEVARQHFDSLFNHQILNLLNIFPPDHIGKEGQPFWSGPKRAPSAVFFDPTDPLHVHFVTACANLIAFNLGIPQSRDEGLIAQKAASVHVPEYKPKVIKVEIPGEENKNQQQEASPEDEQVIAELLEQLKVEDIKINPKEIFSIEFEKDDDNNFHIDFIHAAANLRARNYKIHECEIQKTKMIAGKIIPAIATTTAMITGCVTAEIFKFVQGFDDLDSYKNGFINLALPLFVFSEPTPANQTKSKDYDPILMGKVKAVPEGFTIYDKIVLEGPLTFQQFFDQMKEKYNVDVTLVSSGKVALFNGYLPGNKHGPRKARLIEDVYREIAEDPIPEGRAYLAVEIGGSDITDGDDVAMPTIKYYFTKQ